MKKNLFKVLIAAALVLSVALLAACKDSQPVTENATVNRDEATAATVKSGEMISVTPDAAIDIALDHAGVSRENAVMFGTPTLDEEKGKSHYDIEFGYDGFEYDYEIAVVDGTVLKAEKERENTAPSDKKPAAPENTEPPVTEQTNSGYISVDDAKQKALENAGVKPENATFLKAYYDSDDIVPHFDVKFVSDGYEYEYEIKAADGRILEKDIERERTAGKSDVNAENYITKDEAKKIAYSHASVSAGSVKYSKAELDRDDMVAHYDVEFVEGKYEYEYEINAVTGKVIAFDKDFND